LSISTYAEAKSAVANRLRRADTSSYIDDWFTLAETDIYRRLRTKDMETAFSDTISSGVVALPSSYIDLKFAYINASPATKLDRKTAAWVYQKYPTRSAESRPKVIAREGSNFIFGPYPDSNYTVAGVYYKNLGALSSSAHALFTANPDVYVYGALVMAVRDLKDDAGIARWTPLYEQAILSAQAASDREDYSGGGLEMVSS
jgi:hypothetical protein